MIRKPVGLAPNVIRPPRPGVQQPAQAARPAQGQRRVRTAVLPADRAPMAVPRARRDSTAVPPRDSPVSLAARPADRVSLAVLRAARARPVPALPAAVPPRARPVALAEAVLRAADARAAAAAVPS